MAKKRDELLDHEVDGIRELDNALPRWWLYTFYVTIVFGIAYFVNYHALPTPFFGKSTLVAEYTAEVEAALRLRPVKSGVVVAAVRTDAASLARGAEIFNGPANACNACHRPDLGGLIGPNLTDGYWLHGCAPEDLVRNITTGFPERGMQPYGTTARIADEDLVALVSFIVSKRGSNPPDPKAVDPERDRECGDDDDDDEENGRERERRGDRR